MDYDAAHPLSQTFFATVQQGQVEAKRQRMTSDTSDAPPLEVPPSWEWVPLEQLIDPRRGISYGIVQPGKHDPRGVPIVRVTDVRGGRVDAHDMLRVAQDIEAAYERTRLRGGEVLLSLVGTLGECAIASDRLQGWNVARAMGVVPVTPEMDARWVALCLRSSPVQALMRSWATTTVQATLNLREVRKLPILMPPEWLRTSITETVSALEDKIEQNRQTAQSLDRLARAIFRAWFVDFEPVKAKAAGATSFPSMPQPVFDALPTRFVDSAIGPVPEGWSASSVGAFVSQVRRGITPKYVDVGGVLVVNQKCVRNFEIDLKKARKHDGKLSADRELQDGDVLVNSTGVGTLGRVAQAWGLPEGTVADSHITVVRPSFGSDREFLGHALRLSQVTLESKGEGSTGQTELSRAAVSGLPLVRSPNAVREVFGATSHTYTKLILASRFESQRLTVLRDYLIPRLLNGQLTAKAAQESLP